MTSKQQPAEPRSLLLPLCAVVLCVFLWPAMVTFDAGDWPSPNQYPHNTPAANACGTVGAWLAYYLQYHLGDGAYPLLLFATLASVLRLLRGRIGGFLERALGLALVVACTSISAHLISAQGASALPVGHGGLIGFALGELMTENLSRLGTLIVLASSFFVGLMFATEGWVLKLPWMLKRVGQVSGSAAATARDALASAATPRPVTATEGATLEERDAVLAIRSSGPRANRSLRERATETGDATEETLFDQVDAERANADDPEPQTDAQIEQGKTAEAEQPETAPAENEPRRPKQPAVPIVNFPSPQQTARAEPYPRQIENWVLPSLELLQEPEYSFTAKQEVVVRGQAKVLERTLEEFRIDGRVVEIDTGPVITMFELKLGAGIKVSQIASLSNDIARALKAHAIRVVAPISGKNTVGIEVPNVEKEIVRFKEVMTLAGRRASKMSLPLFLGKDAGGAALVADLASMPHLLIAGTTGSGKSVCINTLIVSLLMTKRPDHVKMILIDPKMVELSQFKEVPHLMCPIVTDLARAEKILEWAVTTMDERYALLAEARVKNVAEYNSLGADQIYERLDPATDGERARISTHLPHIVIMIDELADLMMTSAKEVEHHLSRLAQKSRAVGVHIIVATQRPEAKVVTGLVKSNLPCRICFRVASRMDSRIVLDRNGGEVLMGAGDMLFLPPGLHKLIRAQGTFLQESEVRAILDDLASRAQPEFHPELMRIKMPGADGAAESRDPLFDDAVRIILESKRGSVSLLQRRLTIGYSRASRLIDQMADAGIVGAYKGSQAREVQMSLEEWEALAAQVAADREAGYEADQDDETAADPAYTILSDSSERASSNDPK
jgi:S-DNA-T family DNA segregation ATPase FtsK/SpoIIIE